MRFMPRSRAGSWTGTIHAAVEGSLGNRSWPERPRKRIGGIAEQLIQLAYGWLRFMALLIVGVLAVWSLVLLFG
jgi:hypothetical protein